MDTCLDTPKHVFKKAFPFVGVSMLNFHGSGFHGSALVQAW